MSLEEILERKLPIFCKFLQERIYKEKFKIDTVRLIGEVLCKNNTTIYEVELKSKEGEKKKEYFSLDQYGRIVYHVGFERFVSSFDDKKMKEYVS